MEKEVSADTGPDPLESKTPEELKKLIGDLQKQIDNQELKSAGDMKKINQCFMIMQQTAGTCLNLGLDLMNLGRNLERVMNDISGINNNQVPQRPPN